MKNQFARRTLSLLLAVVMVAGMLPVGALASTVTEPEQLTTQTTLPVESAPETGESVPVSSEAETAPEESVPAPSETETGAPAPSETETAPEESTSAEEETSLPTEPQEDTPAPLALEGEHPDYLSVYNLHWDGSEGGLREGTEDEGCYEMHTYALNVDSHWPVIFYLNTWDETTEAYTKTPVIPKAGSNLVISTCESDNSGIAASAENGDYFVNISSTGTIDDAESYVTYGDLSLPVTITALQYGFFSSSTASWETYLPEQFDLDGNEFYWIYRDEATVSNVQIQSNNDFSDIEKFFPDGALDNAVTLTQVTDNVYKLTVNQNLVNWGKYDPYLLFHVNLTADTTYSVDENSYPGNAYSYLSIDSKKNAKEYAQIDVNGRGYRFYDDGVVFCNYETDEIVTDNETGETWNIWEDAPVAGDCFVNSTNAAIRLPEGFHYDYASNTLTLKDVTLDDLYIGYEVPLWDENGSESILRMLPNADLTLVLEGSNTINNQLIVHQNTNVTLAGTGTLTLNGPGFISAGTTLDMETNGQTILLGSGGYVENYGTIKGETQYVEGYTDLRIAWLDNDGDGWYLPEGATIHPTSMCGLMAECEDYVIFYLYTWDGTKWNAQPVIPTADESWTITKLTDDDIQSGATDSGAYVKVCSQGSIDGKETYLTYQGTQYSLYQGMLDVGFYTAPDATLETVLHGQREYTLSTEGENVLYVVARDPYDNYTVTSIDWDIQGSDENYTMFYTVEPVGEEVWKITFRDACLNQAGLALTAVVNCGEYTQDMHLDLINPNGVTEDPNPVVARFLLEENGGIGHQYRYYADGTSRVYARNVTQWDETNAPIATGFAYDVKTNTLTLTNANLHKLDLTADALLPGKRLTISLVGDNIINYLTVSDRKDVTIQGSGTLTIGANVVMTNRGVLSVLPSAKLCLPSPDAMQRDDSAIFIGTLSYTEGTSYIAYRALTQKDDGTASLDDRTYYGMGGAGIMGMQERLLVFYRAQYTGGQWNYTPVEPAIFSGYSRISLADYQGTVDDTVTEEEKAAAVVMTAKDLGGGEAVQLTIDGEQFDWTLYDLHAAYYSSTNPSPYTYLGGESQHYFETTKNGNNTFYFIVRETDTGITVQDDVTWFIDTWDEDYTAFIPGLTSKEDLVTIEEVTVSGSGNRVWKITVSDAFVDYVNHAYNWKNFQIVPHVTWEYTGNPGETETSDYWAMIINPPQETMQPALRLSLCKDDHTDLEGYQFYADGKVYHDGKEATLPDGMTWDGANLTLENANLDGICLGGFEESYQLNLVLKGENTINSLHIHDNHSVDVTGEGTLTVTGGLRVFDQTILSFPDHALILGADCDTEIWGQVNGEFGYASGYSEIVLYALWYEDRGPTFHGPFTLEEYTCMAMNTTSVLFLKKTMSGEDWIWQPVKPTSEDDRLTIAGYTTNYQGAYSYRNGYDGAYLEESPVWAEAATMFTVDITPNFLGDERVTLTFDGKTCEWYVSPLAFGFFSQPEATAENYFKGDAQYFFDTDPDGDNTFYFITLNALCGYTVKSVTWGTDTWGQDYSCFGDELVTVTEVESDSTGNRVWKITASESYVDFASRYGMYKNFSLNMNAEWDYPGGGHGGIGGYGMFINPPKEQIMPTAAFRIDDYDYYYYEDVQDKILKMGQDEDGNPDVSWVTELPQGVAYNAQSNTMTLTNAQLKTLMFWYDGSWTDEDDVLHTEILLPTDTLTLNLVGESTLAATDRNVFFAYGECNVVITGEGTLNLETTNTFQSEESFSTLWLANGSTLTIGGSATVNLTNKTSGDASSRMYGINSDGTGSLILRDSATLNLPTPEDQAFVTNYNSINGDLSDSTGLKALTLQDNATLNSGSMEFYGCAVTQTGGTWNVSTNLVDEDDPHHIGLYLEETTLNISGGALNILPRYEEENYPFKGIQLATAQLNMTGGSIQMESPYTAGGYGIVSYWNAEGEDGSVTVTGGTIDITTVPITDDQVTFAAMDVGILTMEGGTINASGELDVENLTVKDGTINQTSNRAEGFWVINGSIVGGELNLTDAGLGVSNYREDIYNSARFDISGGKITITGTDAVAEMYEYAGLTNYGYLSMNGGELIVNMLADVAVSNFGTFHQMGGEVSLTGGGDAALRSSGTVLLNSGTMDITGPVGVLQSNEENESWTGKPEERFFQVGGGAGDHKLTIHATDIGICADGVVELTGGCQVDIQVTGENGRGILAENYERLGVQQTNVLIHAAANLNVNATDVGIFALSAPVSIYSDTMEDGTVVAPTVTLRAATAVAEQRTEETSNFTFGEDIGLYSAAGAGLTQWGTNDDETYYLLDEVGNAATWVEISRADDTKGLFAQFANIDGKQYRIYEKDGVQTVYTLVTNVTETGEVLDSRWVEDTLPKGVSYDLTTNTLTLARNTSLTSLYVDYAKKNMGQVTILLPSRDLTIQLSGNATIAQLELGSGLNTTLQGGTLTLTDNSSVMSTLTVAKGAGLTINAGFAVYTRTDSDYVVGSVGKLIVEKGAKLTNNEVIDLQCDRDVYVDVQGTFAQGKNGVTTVGWNQRDNITGNLTQKYQTLVCYLSSEEELDEVLALETLSKYKQVVLCTQQLTLRKDYEIPANAMLNPVASVDENDQCGGTLTIAKGVTVTLKGGFVGTDCDDNKPTGIQNKGTLILAKGGVMYLNGNFSGNRPTNKGGKIYPQASKVTATASTTAFDLYDWETRADDEEYAPLTLSVNVETKAAEEPLNRVTWTSSNKKVIDPDDIKDNGNGTYTVTEFRGTGKVTLTATTIDGAKKTAKVTVNVTYLGSDKLTATTTDSVFEGLIQVEELVTMLVYSRETMVNWLYTNYYTNLVEEVDEDETYKRPLAITFKSSNPKVAEVDVYGNIVGKKAGTAKITATMNIPGDKRSVSMTVKVVEKQIVHLSLWRDYVETESEQWQLLNNCEWLDFPLKDFEDQKYEFPLYVGASTWKNGITKESAEELNCNDDTYIPASELKWASSDTSIATVKANKAGYAMVTIKAKAHGVFTITATATDTNKEVASVVVTVKDYTPRLSNPSITLNPKLEGGVVLDLIPSYDSKIEEGGVSLDENADGKLELVESYGTYSIYADLENSPNLKNQTIKTNIHVITDKGEFDVPLKVTVKNSVPKTTVTQDKAFDLTYSDSEVTLTFTAKDAVVTGVELVESEKENDNDFEIDGYGNVYTLTCASECTSPYNTKLKFKVELEGYTQTVDVNLTLKTKTSKIKLTTTPNSSVINTALTDIYHVRFKVLDADGENVLRGRYSDADAEVYAGKEYVSSDIVGEGDETYLVVDLYEPYSGTLTVKVRRENWANWQTTTHKVSKSSKDPTLVLDGSALTMYRTLGGISFSTKASLSQGNILLTDLTDFECTNADGQSGIELTYDKQTGMVVATFTDPENPVKKGTYTFTATAFYKEEWEYAEEAALDKKVSIKVNVVATEPKFKLASSSIKLNTKFAGMEEMDVPVNYAQADLDKLGLDLCGLEVNGNKIYFWNLSGEDTTIIRDTLYSDPAGVELRATFQEKGDAFRGLTVKLLNEKVKKASYTIYPIVEDKDGAHQYVLNTNKLTLTVGTHSGKVSVDTKASGTLDTLLMRSEISYTVRKVKNADFDYVEVKLLKEDGTEYGENEEPLFLIRDSGVIVGEAFTLALNPKYPDGYTAGKTYKPTLRFEIAWNEDGECLSYVEQTVSIKVNQSAAKITASTVNYYQAEESVTKSIQLNLTSPVGAGIGRVELNEKKTSKELLTALALPESEMSLEGETEPGVFSSGDVYFDEENPSHAVLDIKFWNPGVLKAGKSYSLYLDVYPYTLATTQKPTTVKVTVKVAK